MFRHGVHRVVADVGHRDAVRLAPGAGWTATVDGRRQRTEMVAPALVATAVPAGTHQVIFRFRGWHDYPLLFALGAAALLALAYIGIKRARSPGIARAGR